MEPKKYKITCLNCKGSNEAIISEYGKAGQEYIIDLNTYHQKNPDKVCIISGRYRGDMHFGWECLCGNDSRVARLEVGDVDKLVINGGRSAIEKIVAGLKIADDKKFRMEQL